MLGDDSATPAAVGRRPWYLRWALRVLLAPVVLYLVLVVAIAAMQASLIFPGRATQGRPEARVTPPEGAELIRLRARDGTPIVAMFGRALLPDGRPDPGAATRPTLLYFYGNGMCLAESRPEFDAFRRMGANVMIPDYAGFGLSGGRASERGCYAAADAAYAHLRARDDVDPSRIVAAGWSLGGAVAIDVASREPVAGLITFCTFTSMVEMAGRQYPFLPTSLLLRHRFESERKLRGFISPALIAHGTDDRLIPFGMARRLAAACRGPVTLMPVAGAGHNDFFGVGGPWIRAAMVRFLGRVESGR